MELVAHRNGTRWYVSLMYPGRWKLTCLGPGRRSMSVWYPTREEAVEAAQAYASP